ncbi:EpsG family protein [Planktomarina sp.]|nr:EpsG family protein [Planktomarina sp.]
MWFYWTFYIGLSFFVMLKMRPVYTFEEPLSRVPRGNFFLFLIILFVGLRHEVGPDWYSYLRNMEYARGISLIQFVSLLNDPGYGLLNWVGANFGGGIYFVNSFSAALLCFGILTYCNFQPRPRLALLVALPYLIIFVGMGYTRQSVAMGLVMLALVFLQREQVIRFILFVILGALFHKTALICLLFGILYKFKGLLMLILSILISAFLIIFLSQTGYIYEVIRIYFGNTAYNSSGATLRVGMTTMPAVIFLIWRKRFLLAPKQKRFWVIISILTLGFLGLIFIIPNSTTAIDRILLYLIPLQIMVLSHLPSVFGRLENRNPFWVYSIIGYNGIVLFGYLFYGVNRDSWIPYQFYPWFLVWS